MAGNAPEQLATYIRLLSDFVTYTEIDGNYGHVGATLADAVLQSNNNYERNVRCRIARIRKDYAGEPQLSDLKRLLLRIAADELIAAQNFLDWKGTRKPGTFLDLVDLLQRESVDTEYDLRQWLSLPDSREKLLAIRFVGPKTADYLKILVGLPVAAMDRHLLGFLELAGLGKLSYSAGQDVVHKTADLMQLDRAHLDHSIWRYMSGGKASSVVQSPQGHRGDGLMSNDLGFETHQIEQRLERLGQFCAKFQESGFVFAEMHGGSEIEPGVYEMPWSALSEIASRILSTVL